MERVLALDPKSVAAWPKVVQQILKTRLAQSHFGLHERSAHHGCCSHPNIVTLRGRRARGCPYPRSSTCAARSAHSSRRAPSLGEGRPSQPRSRGGLRSPEHGVLHRDPSGQRIIADNGSPRVSNSGPQGNSRRATLAPRHRIGSRGDTWADAGTRATWRPSVAGESPQARRRCLGDGRGAHELLSGERPSPEALPMLERAVCCPACSTARLLVPDLAELVARCLPRIRKGARARGSRSRPPDVDGGRSSRRDLLDPRRPGASRGTGVRTAVIAAAALWVGAAICRPHTHPTRATTSHRACRSATVSPRWHPRAEASGSCLSAGSAAPTRQRRADPTRKEVAPAPTASVRPFTSWIDPKIPCAPASQGRAAAQEGPARIQRKIVFANDGPRVRGQQFHRQQSEGETGIGVSHLGVSLQAP